MLNLPDRVFRLIGSKPRLGAGRPSSLIIASDTPPAFIGAPPYTRPALLAPVQQGPVGDSPPAFIGARRAVLHR